VNTKPYNILVVDDDPIIRDMMVDILALEGYPIEVVSNGQEALEKLRGPEGYLVFLDLLMPNMNGRDVCEQLNAEPEIRARHIIILMSALDNLASARTLHVNSTLPKPFAVEDLLRIVQPYMGAPLE
jgi:CheY-like chemotaxis protein